MYLCAFVALLGYVMSSPADWEGTFNDPVYGGNFKVCVTYSSEFDTYYAQGKFSDVGYIRGTVDAFDQWTGEYWMAGREGKHGSFNFSLTDPGGGNPLEYSGYFNEMPGYMYSFSGEKSSSSTPSDLECFRSDLSLLTSSSRFDFTGLWTVNGATRYMYATSQYLISSYFYAPPSDFHGFQAGPLYSNGQVHSSNWYEDGDWQGLYLFVAKNDNTLYSLWWEYDALADFDYSMRMNTAYFGQSVSVRDESIMVSYEDSNVHACYMLSGDKEEKECAEEYDERLDEEDEEGGSQVGMAAAGATLAFAVANVVTVLAIIATVWMRKSSAAASADSATL